MKIPSIPMPTLTSAYLTSCLKSDLKDLFEGAGLNFVFMQDGVIPEPCAPAEEGERVLAYVGVDVPRDAWENPTFNQALDNIFSSYGSIYSIGPGPDGSVRRTLSEWKDLKTVPHFAVCEQQILAGDCCVVFKADGSVEVDAGGTTFVVRSVNEHVSLSMKTPLSVFKKSAKEIRFIHKKNAHFMFSSLKNEGVRIRTSDLF